jgi:hypothetical protein
MIKKMTEIEKVKAEIKVLEKKLSFLEEIEKQPRMNLEQEGEYAVVSYHDKVYYRLEGEDTFSWYIKKDVSDNYHIHYRSPNLVMVEDAETERLLEGLYYNHIQVKKEKVAQEPEENEWKSVALRFGEKMSGYLSDGYYELSPDAWFRWAVFTYGKEQQMKDAVRESVKWCEEHPDKDPLDWLKPQTPEQTSQSLKEAFVKAQQTEKWKEIQKLIDEEDNDKNFKNSLDLIKEWGEKNKPPTLKELLWEWWEDIFTVDSDLDADASIDVLVDIIDKKFIPPSHDTNGYEWEKCLKIMREKLR